MHLIAVNSILVALALATTLVATFADSRYRDLGAWLLLPALFGGAAMHWLCLSILN